MPMAPDTRNRYVVRGNALCKSIQKMFEVDNTADELDHIQKMFVRWQELNATIMDTQDVKEVSGPTQSLELSVKTWWKKKGIVDAISDAMEDIYIEQLLPDTVPSTNFTGSVQDMIQEIMKAHSTLMGVYNGACSRNNMARHVPVWMDLKKKCDDLVMITRDIARVGEL